MGKQCQPVVALRIVFTHDHDLVKEAIDRSTQACERRQVRIVFAPLEATFEFVADPIQGGGKGLLGVFTEQRAIPDGRCRRLQLLQDIADALVGRGQRARRLELAKGGDRGDTACNLTR